MADARVGQQGTLTRVWARRGTRPRAPRDTRTRWACSFGAVCPASGAAAGPVPPAVNTEAMNARRAEFSRSVAAFVGKTIPRMGSFPSSPHAVPVPGGAGRHGPAAPVVPDTLSLLTPPPPAVRT